MNPHAQAHAQALGKLGGKAGTGNAKARSSEQSRAAVMARWSKHKKRRKPNAGTELPPPDSDGGSQPKGTKP